MMIRAIGYNAVYGRPLKASEVLRMNVAASIINAYKSRARSGDWVKWAKKNKRSDLILGVSLFDYKELYPDD